jgi:hypothetical protein
MKNNLLTHVLLAIIAVALVVIAIRPYVQPAPAEAQSLPTHPFYIEPGAQMLRQPEGATQIYGKVIIDLRTGNVWGFPTGTLDAYPSNPIEGKPVTSHPFLLGKYAFEDIDQLK